MAVASRGHGGEPPHQAMEQAARQLELARLRRADPQQTVAVFGLMKALIIVPVAASLMLPLSAQTDKAAKPSENTEFLRKSAMGVDAVLR